MPHNNIENNNNDQSLSATAEIVSSYLLNHKVDTKELDNLIEQVYNKISNVATNDQGKIMANAAVSVEDSITPDYIICLEDGKKLKMLKRYLRNNYDMSPEEYRRRWGLPLSYPMVAPNYAAKRSQLAKNIGLGKQSAKNKLSKKAKYTKPTNKAQNSNTKLPNGKLEIIKSSDILKSHAV